MKLHTFTSHILNPFLTRSITKYSTTQSTIFFYYFTLLYFRTYIPRFLIVLLKLLYFLFISDLLYLRTHKSVFQLLSFYISFPPPKLILTQNKKIHRTYSGSTQSRKIYQIHKTYLSFTQSRKIPPSKLT
jgi:hypothetical protein